MSDAGRLERMYAEVWDAHGDAFGELDRSLDPRSGEAMYDAAARLGIAAGWLVLDAGCGRGTHSLDLARRFGCRVIGIDAVRGPVAEAARRGDIQVAQARVEAIPAPDCTFDLVWCRDM